MQVDLRVSMLLNAALERLGDAVNLLDGCDTRNTELNLYVIAAYNRTVKALDLCRENTQAEAKAHPNCSCGTDSRGACIVHSLAPGKAER